MKIKLEEQGMPADLADHIFSMNKSIVKLTDTTKVDESTPSG